MLKLVKCNYTEQGQCDKRLAHNKGKETKWVLETLRRALNKVRYGVVGYMALNTKMGNGKLRRTENWKR
jgi:hypothetical protein